MSCANTSAANKQQTTNSPPSQPLPSLPLSLPERKALVYEQLTYCLPSYFATYPPPPRARACVAPHVPPNSTPRPSDTHKHTHATHKQTNQTNTCRHDHNTTTKPENIELKKLVYLYLINYAKTQPELTLLAVNTFVKDANDPNPLIRALAVRTMGCIRVEKITEYLCEPLRKALRDDVRINILGWGGMGIGWA